MAEIIVEEILWSDSAKFSFSKIVEYLEENWNEKETGKFVKRIAELLSALKRFPEMGRPSIKRKNVHIVLLNKQTQMIYHYKPRRKQIEILLFWSMKQDPSKFKY